MILTFKGRNVQAELEFSGRSRDPVDAFAGAAHYLDTGADLTDGELDDLQDECSAEIQDAAHLHNCGG
jgi:hypothetical protein